MTTPRAFLTVLAALSLAAPTTVLSQAPRALPDGESPSDVRLAAPKDLNGFFPFFVPPTMDEWETRAATLRERLQVVLGLWPMPTKTDLNAVIHGEETFEDYKISKVYFESAPGFYVTGSLFQPVGFEGPRPGILCPHGHWSNGRFYVNGNIRQEIANGAERFESEGRNPLVARSVQLARMGAVVFLYDMIGYADNQQIPESIAHRFAKQRPDMIDANSWGLFSPQAESHFQSVMGLQTWNSIRALDFIESLPNVDSSRLAVTGASGGGTQTFILAALDERLDAAFPAVMVSTAMQGGCTCENASGLRIDTGNVEIAGLFAPKPMGLTSADDWTVDMETNGFPDLKRLYELYDAGENVQLTALTQFGHNYNAVSRRAMYQWFNTHLDLGLEEPILERPFGYHAQDDLTVWNDAHPQPEGGEAFERQLLQGWRQDTVDQLMDLARDDMPELRKTLRVGFRHIIGRTLNEVGSTTWDLKDKYREGDVLIMTGLVNAPERRESLPVTFLYPDDWNRTTTIWPMVAGKAGLFTKDGAIKPVVEELVASGRCVVGLDLIHQGEFRPDGSALTQAPRVANTREFAGYTLGYNHSVFAQRTHDLLTLIDFVTTFEKSASKRVELIGVEGAGAWVAAAISQAGDAVDAAAIDLAGFRFIDIADIRDPLLLPGASKYSGAPAMVGIAQTPAIWLTGVNEGILAAITQLHEPQGIRGPSSTESNLVDALESLQ